MKFRPVLLAPLLLLAARAEHGNLSKFNGLTSRWYQVAKTPVANETVPLAWTPDGSRLYHALETKEGRRLVTVDPSTGTSGVVATGALSWEEFRLDSEGRVLLKTTDGWKRWDPGAGAAIEVEPPSERGESRRDSRRNQREAGAENRPSRRSPDGRWEVALQDGVVVLKELPDGPERELGRSDGDGVFRGDPLWAPDSSRFALWKEKDVDERIVHYIESSPKDQLQPKHFTRPYPKPGDEIDTRAPWVFFTTGDAALPVDADLVGNPFECRHLAWRQDSRRLTFECIGRGFDRHHVIEIDSATRKQKVLVREESDTFVFVYGNSFRHDLGDGEEILWMSERDGWKHLYLLDGRDGSTIRQLTRGEWIVREVVRVDEEKREVLVKVSGCHPGQDPYHVHFARVLIDGGDLVLLTDGDGTHDRIERSPCGKYYTCRWSRVDKAPVTELRRWEDGKLIATLAEADDSDLRATGWPLPLPFAAKDRDGRFDIHGIVCLPPDFDPSKKYPVIEHIYAGPQDSFVPKSWSPWLVPKHEVAVHGFIVVQIDGKGTANRCREFHHFCHRNLKDAGLPDRIAWLKKAAERWPQMDLERVGIFGGSAGGQNALGALLFHGDFYKAAAADCGCHDNRMDKIWWNEQWMGWPVGPHYADNSNVTHAAKLQGALLLTVGEVDTNVDPSSTFQVINALIAADKDFEFLPMTGRNHGSGEERYAQRRRVDFFLRHLGGPR